MALLPMTRTALPMAGAARTTAITWISGGAAWLAASLIGAGATDGSSRFYAAEAVWLVAQILLLAGVVSLRGLGLHGDRRLGRAGFGVAIAGRVGFIIAEAVSIATGEVAEAILPIAALLTAAGMIMAGIAIARESIGHGWRRFAPFAMGVFPVVFMFPLAATGAPPDAAVALWAVPTLAIGLAARNEMAPR